MQEQAVALKETSPVVTTGLLTETNELAVVEGQIDTEKQARINEVKAELADIRNSQTIINFGSPQQSKMAEVSRDMIGSVKNKDAGPASDLLNDMVLKVRGLDTSEVTEGKEPGFFGRLFGAMTPIAKFAQKFETVESQMNAVERSLEQQVVVLSKDIAHLESLYDATLEHFRSLEYYIAAGQLRLTEVNENEIPALKAEAEAGDDMVKVEELRALQAAASDLERKVHDLKLTRQVVMQTLPTISDQIENDKSLINQINSVMVNTLPLWHVQVAQAIKQANTKKAAEAKKSATDLNNQLLKANSEASRENNRMVREEMERGIFDIEAIEESNRNLIGQLMDSVEIAEAGRKKRMESENSLMECESNLKQALMAA